VGVVSEVRDEGRYVSNQLEERLDLSCILWSWPVDDAVDLGGTRFHTSCRDMVTEEIHLEKEKNGNFEGYSRGYFCEGQIAPFRHASYGIQDQVTK
jgi:hypothetical protein